MKRKFLSLLLTFSFIVTSASSVFATNDKTFNGKTKVSSSFGKQDEEKQKTFIVVLKENSNINYESLKTAEGKKERFDETKSLRENFKKALDEKTIPYEVLYEYDFLFAGFALKMSVKDAKEVEKMDLVDSLEVSNEYVKPKVQSQDGKFNPEGERSIDSNNLIKLSESLQKTQNGQGRVVAVLDTGVDVNHKILKVTDVSKGKYPTSESMNAKMQEAKISYGSWRNDKVVYAHNYNTNGTNVKEEIKEESHGMHVSGIAVGNPTENETFIKDGKEIQEKMVGVAPEAQLIFMGVFNGEVTYTHLYAKAVEDSVKLGADSINLSLGSANGTEAQVGKSMEKAITFAKEMGVMVVIAAGNDGHFGYSKTNPPATNPDYGTLGSPAVAKDSLAVAAMWTTVERTHTISVVGKDKVIKTGDTYLGNDDEGNKIHDFIGDNETEKDLDVVYVGLGQESDYTNKNVKDKVALIERGAISFGEKVNRAQEKGAKGVIIYNHKAGGDEIFGMIFGEYEGKLKIPSLFIGNTDGEFIKSNANSKVKFTKYLTALPYAKGGQVTDFSSYGISTDGEFKPDISAPGGLIYSSINNNKYMSMNGTSMAAPHVAGATAIIRDALNKRHPEIKGSKEYDVLKAVMMSTADPIVEDADVEENYFSPRKQGAGAINVEKAISSDLYVVDSSNNPKAYLRNVGSTFDIKLKVVNIGNVERKLKYETVLGTDVVKDGKFELKTKTLAKITGKEIVVPAKGETEVTIPIDARKFEPQLSSQMPNGYFLEGFVFFNDSADGAKAVSIAFSGFKGDWTKAPLWEKPVYDFDLNKEEPIYFKWNGGYTDAFTSLATLENNPYARSKKVFDEQGQEIGSFYGKYGEVPLGLDMRKGEFLKDKIAFSPNRDGNKELVEFKGVFFRNAQYIISEVYNENNEKVYENGSGYSAKNSNNYKEDAPRVNAIDQTAWEGQNFSGQILPDGKYKYVIKANSATLGSDDQQQVFDVLIDTKAPEIKKPVVNGKVYKPEVTDELSGVEEIAITYTDSTGNPQLNYVDEKGEIAVPDGIELSKIAVHAFDYAGNISSVNLDGSEYVPPVQEEHKTNIRPIFNVTNYKGLDGKHIEGSENLNMFATEINWREKVGLYDVKGKKYVMFNYINGLIPVDAGHWGVEIVELPEIYEPFKQGENTKSFLVEQDKTEDVVFKGKLKEIPIEKGNGEVNIRLSIEGLNGDFTFAMSYIIKDKNGKTIDVDTLKSYERPYAVAQTDENGNLIGVSVQKAKVAVLPAGEYTAEVTTLDDDLILNERQKKFTVEDGKTTVVDFVSKEIIKDVVSVTLEGLDEIPEGTKVILVDENGEETELKTKFNKKVFAETVKNGKYKVKIQLPDGYKADRNDFELIVDNYKAKETVNLKKVKIKTQFDKKDFVVESEEGFPNGIELVVNKVDATKYSALKDKDVDAYDIFFRDIKTGNLVKVKEGNYKVTMPKRESAEVKDLYYVSSEGKLEKVPFEVGESTVTFTTNHFSVYALEYKVVEKTEDNRKDEQKDKTEKDNKKSDDAGDRSNDENKNKSDTSDDNSKNDNRQDTKSAKDTKIEKGQTGLVQTALSSDALVLSVLGLVSLAGIVISKKIKR